MIKVVFSSWRQRLRSKARHRVKTASAGWPGNDIYVFDSLTRGYCVAWRYGPPLWVDDLGYEWGGEHLYLAVYLSAQEARAAVAALRAEPAGLAVARIASSCYSNRHG